MKKNPSVEVIVLAYNGKHVLKHCVDSLQHLDYPNYSIIIIDNASTDGGVVSLQKLYPRLHYIFNKKNLGYTGGNNIALRQSTKDYVVLLNQDTVVDKQWLTHLVMVAEKDKTIATCQPKVLSLHHKTTFDYAGAAGCYIDTYGYPLCRGRVFDTIEKDKGQYNDQAETFFSCGVSLFIRRAVLETVGYFDEDFFLYAEEIDLCWRMLLAGYKHVYVPQSKVYHVGGYSTKRFSHNAQMLYYLHRNHLQILLKNYSSFNLLKYFPVKLFLDILTLGAFVFTQPRRSIAILRSFLWLISYVIPLFLKRKRVQRLRKVTDHHITRLMVQRSIALSYYLRKQNTFKDYVPSIPYFT